jgi:molybdenum cofactor cytidylyltransferase
VLAAGESKRFGPKRQKLVLEFGGEPLVRWVAVAAVESRLEPVIVVVGAAADEVRRAVAGLPVKIAYCADYSAGQSATVAAGLGRVDPEASGVLFLPGDQPFIDGETIELLIAAHERGVAPVVTPTFRGRRGAPVLFDRALFGKLARLSGDEGGRQLLRGTEPAVLEVELASELPLLDVDTPEDYRRLLALLS